VTSSDLPPIEDLQISVEEKECFCIGKISSCVNDLVVVQSLPGVPVLDLVKLSECLLKSDQTQRLFHLSNLANKMTYLKAYFGVTSNICVTLL